MKIARSPGLTEKVARALMEEITGGGYEVGDWLPPEQVLASRFGVSRTVLREAISQLKAEGLVQGFQGRGIMVASNRLPQTFVLAPGTGTEIEAVMKIIELRMGVETEAAGLAALHRTPRDLREMRTAIEEMARALEASDVELGVEADLRYHRALCIATRNPHYLSFYEFLSQFLRENISVSRRHSARRRQRSAEAQREHQAVYDAIEAGDPEAARQAMRRHVDNTARRLAAVASEETPGPAAPDSSRLDRIAVEP
ncbi:MAG: FadR/GntR family transcriptional regulator [Tistlia sp.]|uniref:FadR/GntR family transcriptional regulator n=1 Tax=Tistlia sp. TaxID=3057121 RepID=UPI0034A55AE5